MYLTSTETEAIVTRVKALEAELGIEIVTLVVGKADVYPETVWKAFALGAALTGLVITIGDVLRPDWVSASAVLWSAIAILGIGAVCGALAVYVPSFARLFLRKSRAALEVDQYARVQFLERQLFATPARTAVLLLVSLLERRVVILPDTGLRDRVTASDWDAVIGQMTEPLRAGQVGRAVLAGLAGISELLAGKGVARGRGNIFADAPIEDAGP